MTTATPKQFVLVPDPRTRFVRCGSLCSHQDSLFRRYLTKDLKICSEITITTTTLPLLYNKYIVDVAKRHFYVRSVASSTSKNSTQYGRKKSLKALGAVGQGRFFQREFFAAFGLSSEVRLGLHLCSRDRDVFSYRAHKVRQGIPQRFL